MSLVLLCMDKMVGIQQRDCRMLFNLDTGTHRTLTVEEKVETEWQMTAEIISEMTHIKYTVYRNDPKFSER